MKNILFDFGGIFVDLDLAKANMGVQTYVGMGIKGIYNRHSAVFDAYERGHLAEKDFIEAVAKVGIPQNKVAAIWNSMIVGMPTHRLDFVKALRKDYNIYLYSNINTLHEMEVGRLLEEQNGITMDAFRNLFKGSWFSHHIGMRKPDANGFELILAETGIKAEEMLFIDDSEANIAGAKAVGLKAVVHDPSTDIVKKFPDYIKQFNS